MRFRGFLLFLLLWTVSPSLRAQTYGPICTAEMLDVRVSLPPEALAASTSGHLLVLDVRNRAKEPCNLSDFIVHLPTQEEYGSRFGGGPDRSTAAKTFANTQSRMLPGGEAHRLIAWSSVPQTQEHLDYDRCLSLDGLTALSGNKVILDVQHLWLVQCGEAWISSMRAGAFVPGEELSAEWMARYSLSRNDISEPLPPSIEPAMLRSSDSISYLKSSFESGYNGWFTLWLERPIGNGGRCAFRTLRRREADGHTTVVVNHCSAAKENSPEASKRFFEILLSDYRMLPKRVGHVDYESTSEIVHGGRTVAASGIATVEVRDPTDPMLPAIETNLKPCRADQLALQALMKLGNQVDTRNLAPMANVPRAGRVYTVTNSSQETCLVGGIPDLQFPSQPGFPQIKVGLGACRDCSDALFTPRGQHWITLEPARSAHFIVTGKPVYGIYHNPCALLSKLVFVLPAGTMQLDYGLASCGQIDVSAWRDGAYDDDPLNLRYSLAKKSGSSIAPPSELPEACAKVVTPETSLPYMFPSQRAVQFGLSSRPSTFRDNAPLAIWVSNPTDKEVGVMTCMDLDGFFIGGFDVLDQSGNRVLAKNEVKEKDQAGRSGMPGYPRQLMMCYRNFAIPIQPHSCIHGDLDKPGYDLVKNLGSMYPLPAGSYQIVPRLKEGEKRLQTTGLAVEITP